MMKVKFKAFSLTSFTLLVLSFIVTLLNPVFASDDPLVVIATDNTSLTPCKVEITRNVNTPHATATTSPCTVGTIISSKEVFLSQALKNKEKYTIKLSSSASTEDQKKFWIEVDNLMQDKGNEIKANLAKSGGVTTNSIACGTSTTLTYYWSFKPGGAFNAYITSTLDYSKSADCAAVTLIRSTQLETSGPYAYWDKMLYSNSGWDPGCPNLSYGQATYNMNSAQSPGYYFQPHLAGVWPCATGVKTYINMGPVN